MKNLEENDIIDYINDNYPIMVADGAYAYFLDDYVSLYYQNRILPPKRINKTTKETSGKREILGEIRISNTSMNKLLNELNKGIDVSISTEILGHKTRLWTDPIKDEVLNEKVADLKLTRTKEDTILFKTFSHIYDNVNEIGRTKITDLLVSFLHEHLADLNEIKEKHFKRKDKVVKNETKTK